MKRPNIDKLETLAKAASSRTWVVDKDNPGVVKFSDVPMGGILVGISAEFVAETDPQAILDLCEYVRTLELTLIDIARGPLQEPDFEKYAKDKALFAIRNIQEQTA